MKTKGLAGQQRRYSIVAGAGFGTASKSAQEPEPHKIDATPQHSIFLYTLKNHSKTSVSCRIKGKPIDIW
jgi:hypothetical protein